MARLSPTVRSIFAVLDGLLLFLAVDAVFYLVAFLGLKRSFDTPTIPYLTANLLWTVAAALLGGYTAARVAHRNPVLHGLLTAIPFVLLSAFNLHKGLGGQRTPFVLAYNTLVPLSFVVGAFLFSRLRPQRVASR